MQVVLVKKGGVKKTSRGTRINQRPNRYRRVVRKKEMNKKGEMAGLRVGEGCGDWEGTTQPDPYWLGLSFFGRLVG